MHFVLLLLSPKSLSLAPFSIHTLSLSRSAMCVLPLFALRFSLLFCTLLYIYTFVSPLFFILIRQPAAPERLCPLLRTHALAQLHTAYSLLIGVDLRSDRFTPLQFISQRGIRARECTLRARTPWFILVYVHSSFISNKSSGGVFR